MDKRREAEPSGGLGTAVLTIPEAREETADLPCQWPTLAIIGLAMRDADAALAADPLFHLCPDGQRGRIDVRYWYFHPLYFSCWHCSAGGIRVAEPETIVCRHGTHQTRHPLAG